MPLILNGRFLLKVRGPGGLTEPEQHAHKADAHAFQTLSLSCVNCWNKILLKLFRGWKFFAFKFCWCAVGVKIMLILINFLDSLERGVYERFWISLTQVLSP